MADVFHPTCQESCDNSGFKGPAVGATLKVCTAQHAKCYRPHTATATGKTFCKKAVTTAVRKAQQQVQLRTSALCTAQKAKI